MSSATKDTVTVFFDPTSIGKQADVISAATSQRAGAMSAAQAAKLDGLVPGGGATLTQVYDLGASAADQTANIDPAKGGGIVAKAQAALAGRLLAALTSTAAVIFDVLDAAIPKVLAAGAFIQNDPGFGSPVMGSQKPNDFVSYTADGIGPSWAGTGMTAKADAGTPAAAFAILTVNDAIEFNAMPGRVGANCYGVAVGPPLAIVANTIAPVRGIHHVGAGLLKNITVPFTALFSGSITLIPDALFTYDATGNIFVALGSGTAVVGRPMVATYDDAVGKWFMSY